MLERLKKYRLWLAFSVIILAIAIPLTISQIQKQQEIRSRAAGGAISLDLSPQTSTNNQGSTFSIQVSIGAADNNISGVDITMNFNPSVLELVSFVPSTAFSSQLINVTDNNAGTLHYTAVAPEQVNNTGTVSVGTLNFKGKTAGVGNVTFGTVQITGQGVTSSLPISSTATGTYTIGQPPTPTLGPNQGRIQGHKVVSYLNASKTWESWEVDTVNSQTVSVDGTINSILNPFSFGVDVPSGGSHTVTATEISGYTLAHTLCYNTTTCHDGSQIIVSGNSINVSNNSVGIGGYADLWWHYKPQNAVVGFVYVDSNGNGIVDQGDKNFTAGTNVSIVGTGVQKNFTTDKTGYYGFTNLPAEGYTITVTVPSGYTLTTGNNTQLKTVLGQNNKIDFGIKPNATPTPTPTGANTPTPTVTGLPNSPTVTQTPTPTPIPSIPPGHTALEFDLNLPEVEAYTSTAPLHSERNLMVKLTDTSDNSVTENNTGKITYDSATKRFNGTVDMGNLKTGKYIVRVKTTKYLRKKLLPEVINITGTVTNKMPTVTLVLGDVNDTAPEIQTTSFNFLDIQDYNVLKTCGYGDIDPKPMSDSSSTFNSESCKTLSSRENADLNDDGIIDQTDYIIFIKNFSLREGD